MAEKNILRNKKGRFGNRNTKVVSQLFYSYKGPPTQTPLGLHSYHHSIDSYDSFPFITSVENLEKNENNFKTPESSQFHRRKSISLEKLLNIKRRDFCSVDSKNFCIANILTPNSKSAQAQSTQNKVENQHSRKGIPDSKEDDKNDEVPKIDNVLEDSVFKKPNPPAMQGINDIDTTPINRTKNNKHKLKAQQLNTPIGKVTRLSSISSTIKKDEKGSRVSRLDFTPLRPSPKLSRLGSFGNRSTSSPPRITNRDIHQIKLKIRIGRGSFGAVYMGVFRDKIVAVKKLSSKMINKSSILASFRAECNVLGLKHRHIVEVLAAYINQSSQTLVVIMEYAGVKNLLNIINDSTEILSLKRRVRFTMEITEALKFIHQLGIVHLDVKPANVMITLFDRCKLADFGCSRLVKNDRTCIFPSSDGSVSEFNEVFFDQNTRKSFDFDTLDLCHLIGNNCLARNQKSSLEGTVIYKAPELLMGQKETLKCDIYSLGVTMWHLLYRQTPFIGCNLHLIIHTICKLNFRPSISFQKAKMQFENCGNKAPFDYRQNRKNQSNQKISQSTFSDIEEEYKKTIERCWETDADRRYSACQLLPLLASWLHQIS